MSSEEWYRNEDWNEDIEKSFYEKLKRARSQRDQYMVIQALTLVPKHPEITLRLVQEYFDSRKDQFDDVRALLARTEAYLSLADITKALESYKAVLNREEEFPGHSTTAYVDYPYLVATLGVELEYKNAENVLNQHESRLMFPLDIFKWYAAKAIISGSSEFAQKALSAAKVEKSGFRYHQGVGLVGEEHASTIERLIELSA